MLNTLSSTNKSSKRVGRGGKRGKTSGKGHKGQKQHGGHGIRAEIRDTIKRIPKLRGHGKNRARTVVYKPDVFAVNIANLDTLFETGTTITVDTLVTKGLISSASAARKGVKLLGYGETTKKFTIEGMLVSQAAREKITKAGGSVA